MPQYTFRNYRSPDDAECQYEFWLRATDGLRNAWRSNMANVRHLMQHVDNHPGARI